jgi:hypothetical protein
MGRHRHPRQPGSASSNSDAIANPDAEANPNADTEANPDSAANAIPNATANSIAASNATPVLYSVTLGLTNANANPGALAYGGPSADGLDPDGSPAAGSRRRRRPAFYRRRAGGISSGTCDRALRAGRHGRSRFRRPG